MDLRTLRGGMRGFASPLVRPLSTAHGTISTRAGFLLTLMDEEGRYGFGEATPLPDFGTETLAASRRAIEEGLAALIDGRSQLVEEVLQRSAQICHAAPSARSALDGALHDLCAKQAGVSLADWVRARAEMAGPSRERISVQALVSGDQPIEVARSASGLVAEGFATFKLKVAASSSQVGAPADLGFDLERVATLRETIGAEGKIRLDANEAWTALEAERALAAFEPFGIDFVEQPVERSALIALKHLNESGAIPVAADEALLDQGWRACLDAGAASILVLKPAALGGIEPSIEIARRVSDLGLRVIWSSLVDGAVGRATAAALAAGLASGQTGEDEVHGLGTAGLLTGDFVSGCEVVGGEIELRRDPGLGIDVAPVWDGPTSETDPMLGETWVVEANG